MSLGIPLFFIGNSGCGKDTAISILANKLYENDYNTKVLKRYITRKADHSENNHFVSQEKFLQLKDDSYFIFDWKAYNNYYGYSKEDVIENLNSADFVILNVSRTVIDEVNNKFSNAICIRVICEDEIAKERINLRSRDKYNEQRISRFNLISTFPTNTLVIQNNGSLEVLVETIEEKVSELVSYINSKL